MKKKNCDLTLTTPALLKSLLGAYAGSLVRRRKGGGGGSCDSHMKGGYLT